MAIYTTFFLANPPELLADFPGWKPALPVPVRREFRNPFTRQIVEIFTREPEWPQEENPTAAPQFRATAIQGRYEDYLENRLPPFVRQCKHWAAKGILEIEIEPLLTAIGIHSKLESPIYAPRSSGAILREFPPESIPMLIEIDQPQIARQWADALSSSSHTHSAKGERVRDDWTINEASAFLTPIVSLAQSAKPDQQLYLLIEL